MEIDIVSLLDLNHRNKSLTVEKMKRKETDLVREGWKLAAKMHVNEQGERQTHDLLHDTNSGTFRLQY